MNFDNCYYGESIESLPPELAEIFNKKEGRVAFEVIEPVINRNKEYEAYLSKASATVIKNKNFEYTPKFQIKDSNKVEKKESTKLYFPVSQKINLLKYVYGRLFAIAYKSKNSECYIIANSSMIYSWGGFLRHFEKNNNIHWFQIKNIDESRSMLTYAFNSNNIDARFSRYIKAIAYCIDNK